MSLVATDAIDAVAVNDGWATLSIYEFGEWDTLDEPAELLRRKLATYRAHVLTPAYLSRRHELPARIELVCVFTPPDDVTELCERAGVRVVCGPQDDA